MDSNRFFHRLSVRDGINTKKRDKHPGTGHRSGMHGVDYSVRDSEHDRKEEVTQMEGKRIKPNVGTVYQNRGGGKFRCMDTFNGGAVMQNIESKWTFRANGVIQYEDGTIEWDYSTGGRFDHGAEPRKEEKSMKTILTSKIMELAVRLNNHENIDVYLTLTGNTESLCIEVCENKTMVYENRTFVTDESALAAIKQDLIKMIRSATKEENILREKGRE